MQGRHAGSRTGTLIIKLCDDGCELSAQAGQARDGRNRGGHRHVGKVGDKMSVSLSDLVAQREREIYESFEKQLKDKDALIRQRVRVCCGGVAALRRCDSSVSCSQEGDVSELTEALRVLKEDFIYNYNVIDAVRLL